MSQPTIRLATAEDMRAITSKNVDELRRLPFLYIAMTHLRPAEPDIMKSWGVASHDSIADYERLYPGALVAPHHFGEIVDRGELLYNGAEPAADFICGNAGEEPQAQQEPGQPEGQPGTKPG